MGAVRVWAGKNTVILQVDLLHSSTTPGMVGISIR